MGKQAGILPFARLWCVAAGAVHYGLAGLSVVVKSLCRAAHDAAR